MSINRDFKRWLGAGKNTGADMQHHSASTIANRVMVIREKYKNEGFFLETLLKHKSCFEAWYKEERDFVEATTESKVIKRNSVAYLRAFWRFSKQTPKSSVRQLVTI